MRILFVMGEPVISPSNGVLSQIKTWKNALILKGHQVDFYSAFNPRKWQDYDIIHIFVFSVEASELIKSFYPNNPNIVLSPILDTTLTINQVKFLSKCKFNQLRLYNKYSAIRSVQHMIKAISVRSEFEKKYFVKSFGFPEDKVWITPLSYGEERSYDSTIQREPYCFHLSFLADERKNVKRLIAASTKYGFKLLLGGKLRNEAEEKLVAEWLSKAPNAKYLGFLSKEDLNYHYSHAKVFALPSINEGVGIVGLEAALSGCDVVITNIGGPHEYYGKYATNVDPYDIDDIGKSIMNYINGKTFQPKLSKHIIENYNETAIIEKLLSTYMFVLEN